MARCYTDGEIRTAYRQAKDKREQLRILADLNCCSIANIRQILNIEEDKPMKRKHDWDTILGGLGAEPTVEEVKAAAQQYGVTPAQIKNNICRRRATEQFPIPAPVATTIPTADEPDELVRI